MQSQVWLNMVTGNADPDDAGDGHGEANGSEKPRRALADPSAMGATGISHASMQTSTSIGLGHGQALAAGDHDGDNDAPADRSSSPERALQASASARGRPPAKVDVEMMKRMFGMPQPEAAKALGVSLTTLKQVCRRLGLQRWPYRRPCKAAGAADRPSPPDTADVPDVHGAARAGGSRGAAGQQGIPTPNLATDSANGSGWASGTGGALAAQAPHHHTLEYQESHRRGAMLPSPNQRVASASLCDGIPAPARQLYDLGFPPGTMVNAAGFPISSSLPQMSHMGWDAGVASGGHDGGARARQSYQLHLFDGPGQQSSYVRQQIMMQQQQGHPMVAAGNHPEGFMLSAHGEYPASLRMPPWGFQGSIGRNTGDHFDYAGFPHVPLRPGEDDGHSLTLSSPHFSRARGTAASPPQESAEMASQHASRD